MTNTNIIITSQEQTPIVCPEMEELLPYLNEEEYQALEKDILANGCYTPITVNQNMVIIDGHYRYRMFLMLRFMAGNPNVCQCRRCGRYFIPKTKRWTLYCDRVVRDGLTCKDLGLAEMHRQMAEHDPVVERGEWKAEAGTGGRKRSCLELAGKGHRGQRRLSGRSGFSGRGAACHLRRTGNKGTADPV